MPFISFSELKIYSALTVLKERVQELKGGARRRLVKTALSGRQTRSQKVHISAFREQGTLEEGRGRGGKGKHGGEKGWPEGGSREQPFIKNT